MTDPIITDQMHTLEPVHAGDGEGRQEKWASRLVLFMRVMADGTPAVSVHDALLRRRPSQMPGWNGHSFGNTNVVKAETLFTYLRDAVLAKAVPLPQTPASAAAP